MRRSRRTAALLLAAAGALCYANGLTGDFTYDDKAVVRDNPRIRTPARLQEIFSTQYFGGPRGTGTAYRPVLLTSYALQWWIHGNEPIPFHVVNVLGHVAATLLFAALLRRLGFSPPVFVGAALLFAVHPIHVEAVTSIVGRGETQSAALTLAFLLLGLRFADGGRRRAATLLALLSLYLLGNLTKESAAIAPALLFLCLAWRETGGLLARLRQALLRGWVVYAGSAAVLGGVLLLRRWILGGVLKSDRTGVFALENPLAPLPPLDRVLNGSALLLRTLGRLVFPLRLSSDESAWSIRVLTRHDAIGWTALALLAALAIASLGRLPSQSPAAFGFLFFATAALPAANLLFPTGTIFAERLAYLPSAGFCVIVAAAIAGSAEAWEGLPRRRVEALAGVAVLLAARTVVRNPVWNSDEALFTNMVRVSPNSAKAHYDFAYMSAEIGQPRCALAHYRKAIEIYPRYWDAWAGVGRMERRLGDAAAAERAYAESVRIAPTYENGYFGLALAREDLGDRMGAERACREGLRWNPQSLPLAYRFALLLSADKAPGAVHAWHRALAIAPDSLASRLEYAAWLRDAGRQAEALDQVREALRRAPRHAPALEMRRELESAPAPASPNAI